MFPIGKYQYHTHITIRLLVLPFRILKSVTYRGSSEFHFIHVTTDSIHVSLAHVSLLQRFLSLLRVYNAWKNTNFIILDSR